MNSGGSMLTASCRDILPCSGKTDYMVISRDNGDMGIKERLKFEGGEWSIKQRERNETNAENYKR
jgi:hypothetical protein